MFRISQKRLKFGLLFLFFFSFTLVAMTQTKAGSGKKIYDMKWLNANRWRIPIYNDGRFGIDVTRGTGAAGGSWPQPLKNYYIFGAGIWFAYISPKGETCCSYGYNPNSGASEQTPTIKKYFEAGYEGNPDLRIYMFPEDWPPPKDKFTLLTKDGDTVIFCPQETLSVQDAWSCFGDHDPKKHDPGDTKPIGVDIGMTAYVWNLPTNRDIVFFKYDVRNVSGDTLKNCYIGVVLDADVGQYSDDMMAMVVDRRVSPPRPRRFVWNAARTDSLFVDNLAWIYDYDNRESRGSYWEKGTPGAVAYDFLQSPFALDDGRDNDDDGLVDRQEVDSAYISSNHPELIDSDGDGIPAWRDFSEIEQLGMTACKKFPIENDPKNDVERYLVMAGYTHYLSPPPYYPYDAEDETPGDKRFIQSSGPFTLLPESTTTLVVAVIAAKYGEEGQPYTQRDSWDLVKTDVEAQRCYDNNWLLPGPPPIPRFSVIPGDKKVTVVWDNSAERVPDPYYRIASRTDPTYRQYDFEGYKVYKSTDAINWQEVARCDMKNGIIWSDTTLTFKVIRGETTKVESIYTWANDNGLFYSYVDNNVINGMEYYYAVTSFDYNLMRGERLVLEAGIQGQKVIPRSEAANLVLPKATIEQVVGDAKNNKCRFEIKVTNPMAVLNNTYSLEFVNPFYDTVQKMAGYSLLVKLKERDSLLLDTVRLFYDSLGKKRTYSVPYFNGIEPQFFLELKAADTPFVEIKVPPEKYPVESLKVISGVAAKLAWAFRGSDYRLVWKEKEGGGITLDVYDLDNNVSVPFTRLTGYPDARKIKDADGWSFQYGPTGSPSETLRLTESAIYLPGGYLALRQGRPLTPQLRSLIQPGDTWYVYSNKAYGCAPSWTKYELRTQAGGFDTTTKVKLRVKVVPNPYIVTNAWEKTTLSRKLQFINLPNKCKIRIYNMAGDLVRIIEHKADSDEMKNEFGGTATWDLLNTHNQKVASGVYIFYIDSEIGNQTGKFAIVF